MAGNQQQPHHPSGHTGSRLSASLFVAVAALGIQLGYLLESRSDPTATVPVIDAAAYHDAAARYATQGRLADGPFWQPPLFPLLLGQLYSAWGVSIPAARVALAVMGAASCALTCALGALLFNRRTGLIAGFMLAMYGPFVFYSVQLLPAGLAVFLNLAALYLWCRSTVPPDAVAPPLPTATSPPITPPPLSLSAQSLLIPLTFGLLTGLSILTVPNGAVLLMAALMMYARQWRRCGLRNPTATSTNTSGAAPQRRALLVRAVWMIAGAALPVGLCAARNYAVSSELVPISTNGGINLYIGNNPDMFRTIAVRPGEDWRRLTRLYLRDGSMTPARQDGWYRRQVLQFIREQPDAFLQGLAVKTLHLIDAREIPRNESLYVHREYSYILTLLIWQAGITAFPWSLTAPLAAAGLMLALARGSARRSATGNDENTRSMPPAYASNRSRPAIVLLILFTLLYGLSVVVFFPASRYRLPMVPPMLIFAALALDVLCRAWHTHRGRKTETLSAAVRSNAHSHFTRRTIWSAVASAGLVLLAVHLHTRLPTDSCDFSAELHYTVGAAHLHADRLYQAESSLRQALRVHPDHVGALCSLSEVFARTHRPDEAEETLRRALLAAPHSAEVHWRIGHLHRQQGDPHQAESLYRKAVELDPWEPTAHCGLGDILGLQGRLDEALPHYDVAVRFIDLSPQAWTLYAQALHAAGRPTEAAAAHRRAMEANP